MDDEEDDVFEPEHHCWRTTFQEIKCEDRATQTPGPALAPDSGMLSCGVAEEPRPLFHGEPRRPPCHISAEKQEQRRARDKSVS